MGIIRSGILGNVKNRVGGIVAYQRLSKGIIQAKGSKTGRTISSGKNLTAQKLVQLKQYYNLMPQDVQNVFFSKKPFDNYYYYDWVKMNYQAVQDDLQLDIEKVDIVRQKLQEPLGLYSFVSPTFTTFDIRVADFTNVREIAFDRTRFLIKLNLFDQSYEASFTPQVGTSLLENIPAPDGFPGVPFWILWTVGDLQSRKWVKARSGIIFGT